MIIYLFSIDVIVMKNGELLECYTHFFYDTDVKKIAKIVTKQQTFTDLVMNHRYLNDIIPLPYVSSTFNISEDEFIIKVDISKNLHLSDTDAFIAVCEKYLLSKILDKI